MKYSQTLIDDEYESSNIASRKEVFLVISHYGAVQLLIYSACMDLIVTDTKI